MISPLRIFQQAERYRFSAITLLTLAIREAGKGNLGHFSQFNIPIVTMEAFAFELYLKCLLNLQNPGRTIASHDLEWLFNQLSKSTRNAIQKVYNDPSESAQKSRSARASIGSAPKPDFNEDLKSSRDAFAIFRYIYEGEDGVGYSNANYFATEIMEATRAVILSQQSDWLIYAVGPDR